MLEINETGFGRPRFVPKKRRHTYSISSVSKNNVKYFKNLDCEYIVNTINQIKTSHTQIHKYSRKLNKNKKWKRRNSDKRDDRVFRRASQKEKEENIKIDKKRKQSLEPKHWPNKLLSNSCY